MTDILSDLEDSVETGLNILKNADYSDIHSATLNVLEKTGVYVEDVKAIEVFYSHGATIDHKKKIVKLPSTMVEEAIQSSPSEVKLAGLTSENDIILKENKTAFANFSSNIQLVDPQTGIIRQSNKEDLAAATRLCDAIAEIGIYSRALYPLDKPSKVLHLHTAEACFSNTAKHCFQGPEHEWDTNKIIDMTTVAVGGAENLMSRKPVTFVASVSSPLKMTKNFCEVVMTSAEKGFSTGIASMVMAGGTGPIHLAGTLVQTNAEVLAGIVLAQLVNKGAPVIYANFSTGMDLRLGTSPLGSPEAALVTSSLSRLCQKYKIPCWVPGIATDSKQHGTQAAFEKTLTGLSAALAGANLISGIGGIETGLTFDFTLAVLDAEIVRLIQFFRHGIDINKNTLSTDIIHEIGPAGNYLSHTSTLQNMRSLSQTFLFDRSSRGDRKNMGENQSYTTAHSEMIKKLEDHRPKPLSDSMAAEIKSIVVESEKEVGIDRI